jgi:hypothetical protein
MNFSSSPCLVAASHRTIQFLFYIFCCFNVLDLGLVAAAEASNSSSSSTFSLLSSFVVRNTDFVESLLFSMMILSVCPFVKFSFLLLRVQKLLSKILWSIGVFSVEFQNSAFLHTCRVVLYKKIETHVYEIYAIQR